MSGTAGGQGEIEEERKRKNVREQFLLGYLAFRLRGQGRLMVADTDSKA